MGEHFSAVIGRGRNRMVRRPLSFAIAPNSHGWVLSFGEGQLWALFLILSLVVLTWPLL